MPKQDVKIEARAEIAKVFVDGKQIRLSNGAGTAGVPAGEHVISWVVRGAPASKYAVKITAPKEARFEHEDTLGNEGFDAGMTWFRVAEA